MSSLSASFEIALNILARIPFFFEPNFDALVQPLPSVVKKARSESSEVEAECKSVVYGDFLLAKVGNNFVVEGQNRYSET